MSRVINDLTNDLALLSIDHLPLSLALTWPAATRHIDRAHSGGHLAPPLWSSLGTQPCLALDKCTRASATKESQRLLLGILSYLMLTQPPASPESHHRHFRYFILLFFYFISPRRSFTLVDAHPLELDRARALRVLMTSS